MTISYCHFILWLGIANSYGIKIVTSNIYAFNAKVHEVTISPEFWNEFAEKELLEQILLNPLNGSIQIIEIT